MRYMTSEDAVVRAFAARGLGLLGSVTAEDILQEQLPDSHEVRFYHSGEFTVLTVGEFAKIALEQVRSQQAA